MATPLSPEAHRRLSEELSELTTRGRIEIAEVIRTARELGDLKENSDYHAARDAQGTMEARIRQLEAILGDAQIVDDTTASSEVVTAGVIFSVRYEGDDDAERFLVGSIEEQPVDDVSVVSPTSPLGVALIGAKAGDTVTYEAPGGTLKVEIVSIGS